MGGDDCDVCGESVSVAGGISGMWSRSPDRTEGMHLELADGSEWFLCESCIDDLPDDETVTAADVEALRD
jgi:hypothetical protein